MKPNHLIRKKSLDLERQIRIRKKQFRMSFLNLNATLKLMIRERMSKKSESIRSTKQALKNLKYLLKKPKKPKLRNLPLLEVHVRKAKKFSRLLTLINTKSVNFTSMNSMLKIKTTMKCQSSNC